MESVTCFLVWVLRLSKVGREPGFSISSGLRIAKTTIRRHTDEVYGISQVIIVLACVSQEKHQGEEGKVLPPFLFTAMSAESTNS